MLLKRSLTLIIVVLSLFALRTFFAVISNLDRYRQNKEFQITLNEAKWSLETTKIILEEYLINSSPRSLYQLGAKKESFKNDSAFRKMDGWIDRYRLVAPMLSKRRELLYIVDILVAQGGQAQQGDQLYSETAAQAFLLAHEMSSYMIDLSIESTDQISNDTRMFIGALTITLAFLIPFILFVIIWIRKRVFSRIILLDTASCRIADGDYSKEIDISGNDELSRLAHSFSVMQRSVREHVVALAGETDRLSAILHSIGDAVIAVDRSGYIILMNPVAERLTGWRFGEAQGHPLAEVFNIIKEGSRDRQNSPVSRVIETGETVALANHTILVSRSGEEYQIADAASPILTRTKEISGVVLVFRDVTEYNRMQSIMIQSEKMLSVGGLAAGMAHEINNPLSGMLQTASVVETRLSEDIPANRDAAREAGISMDALRMYMEMRGIFRMLALMKESGSRIGRIVNNMLGFARKGPAQVSSHNLCGLVDRTLELAGTDYDMKKEYDFRKILIVKQYEDDLPLIPCDAGQIQQVLLNLLRNGAQAMQEAKTVSPRFLVKVYLDSSREYVVIEIGDNGPGMSEEVKKRIFEPFFTTKPVGIGTGLGLSVSYFIISENHRGHMDVVSSPGEGATFIIKLPLPNSL